MKSAKKKNRSLKNASCNRSSSGQITHSLLAQLQNYLNNCIIRYVIWSLGHGHSLKEKKNYFDN